VDQAAVADGRQQTGEGEVESEDADAEVAFVEGDGVAGAKKYVVEGAGIFAEGGLVVGASVEVIEDGARKAALGEAAKIFDIHYTGRAEGGGFGSHGEYFMEKGPGEAMRKCRGRAQAKATVTCGDIGSVIDSRVRQGSACGRYNCKRGHLKVSATLERNNFGVLIVRGFVFLLQSVRTRSEVAAHG